MSSFGLICETDGCVPDTEKDAQSHLKDERDKLEAGLLRDHNLSISNVSSDKRTAATCQRLHSEMDH